MRRLSTSHAPSAEAFGYWRDAICRNLIGVDIRMASDGFFGSFCHLAIGNSILSEIGGAALNVCRPDHLIGRENEPAYLINIVAEGVGATSQSGNQCLLKPGDIFIHNAAQPYSMDLGSDFRMVTLRVSQDVIERYFLPLEAICALPLSRSRGMGRIAVAALLSLQHNADLLDAHEGEIVVGNALTMVGAACAELLPDRFRVPSDTGLARVDRFIDLNIRHPDLGVSMIAQACGLSRRQLNRIFEGERDTVARVILRRRLERCRLDLISRNLMNRTVGEIAYHWGFNNLSHFSFSFRQAYGKTARQIRQERLGPATDASE